MLLINRTGHKPFEHSADAADVIDCFVRDVREGEAVIGSGF